MRSASQFPGHEDASPCSLDRLRGPAFVELCSSPQPGDFARNLSIALLFSQFSPVKVGALNQSPNLAQ